MEVKKAPKANIETQKTTFFLMGMVVALAVLFVGFEWSSTITKLDEAVVVQDVLAEEEIEITQRDPTPPPPPPPPEPEVPEIIEVTEEKVETKIDLSSLEDDQSKAQIQTYTPPPPPKPVEEEATDEIFVVVEKQPEFPGGTTALMKFLGDNIKYPVIAQENGIQGRVITNFVVERDGSISDVQVVRGQDPSLDKEAVRVIKTMPRWTPGQQRGKPVRVRFTLPVVFRLQN
ncbi:MAG: energy transducer TonB [Bacteroidales bacterium]|jgi:protein TonB|nr:energy transducer TonB [Bacteroidales bacterium]